MYLYYMQAACEAAGVARPYSLPHRGCTCIATYHSCGLMGVHLSSMTSVAKSNTTIAEPAAALSDRPAVGPDNQRNITANENHLAHHS